MITIKPFQIHIKDTQELEINRDFKIIKVGTRYESAYLWAVVDTDSEIIKLPLRVVEDRAEIPPALNLVYIGTVMTSEERFVFHVFIDKTK